MEEIKAECKKKNTSRIMPPIEGRQNGEKNEESYINSGTLWFYTIAK